MSRNRLPAPTRSLGPQTSGARLTRARIVQGVEIAQTEARDIILWCVEPIGFGARVRASGAVSFIYQYRVRGGRSGPVRKLTIGKPGAFSVEEARTVAREHARAVALGHDPQRDKMEARAVLTLDELFERYEAEEGKRLSPRTLANARAHMRNQLKPLANARIDDIRKKDVAQLHAKLSDAPYAANRAVATLSSVFAFAERIDLLPTGTNPARGLRRYPEKNRERMLDADEIAKLWSALIDLQREERHVFAAPAIMLGMLTGWRVGEVRTLSWDAVDLAGREAMIVGKTGPRRAPFPSSTEKLFRYLGEVSKPFGVGEDRGRWVFPSLAGKTRERGPVADWEHERTWRAALTAAELHDIRRHDLRHLIAGVIGLQTGSALRVKEAMGHRSIAMSERYVSPISALQRRSTEQAAALVLAVAEREVSDLTAPDRAASDGGVSGHAVVISEE